MKVPGAPELRIRHDGSTRIVSGPATSVCVDVGGELAQPIVRSVDYFVGTAGDRRGQPCVLVEWGGFSSNLEVVAELAEPIPEHEHVQRVYVLCLGLSRRTKVCDADTGEEILVTGVRVKLVAGEPALAWVDPWVDPKGEQ
ncbi:hypothetical protein K2Z84_05290 [Candidatus Binatia bacterium]|nr:hypothetical protein [Candidatus Binatia bacterium]